MIILPGPLVLTDPLPSGWRRCSSLGCGAPTGHAGEHVPEAVPPRPVAPIIRSENDAEALAKSNPAELLRQLTSGEVPPHVLTFAAEVAGRELRLLAVHALIALCSHADRSVREGAAYGLGSVAECGARMPPEARAAVERLADDPESPGVRAAAEDVLANDDEAGPEVDVGAELRCSCSAEPAELDCPEHGGAALAWIREHEPATMARLLAALREPAPVTRAERIEAAARAVVAPDVMLRAALDLWNNEADPVRARALRALHALRAALCTCTGHGPDLACVEHGEALRKWQAREVSR